LPGARLEVSCEELSGSSATEQAVLKVMAKYRALHQHASAACKRGRGSYAWGISFSFSLCYLTWRQLHPPPALYEHRQWSRPAAVSRWYFFWPLWRHFPRVPSSADNL